MPAKFTVTGGPETARALSTLGRNSTQEKVLRQALRPGAVVIQRAAKNRAPVLTGALQKSIAVGTGRAGPRQGRLLVGHRGQRARISHLVEFGTRNMAAQPYMRPAARFNADTAIKFFGDRIWELIRKEAIRVAFRRAVRRR